MKRRNLWAIAFAVLIGFAEARISAQDQTAPPPTPAPTKVDPQLDDIKEPKKFSEEDVATEFKRLTKVWRPVSVILAGNAIPDEFRKQIELQIEDGKYKSMSNGVESHGKLKLDLSKDICGMDIFIEEGPEKGKTIKCIYKFDDDKLHVAYSLAFDEVRPTEFVSNQDNKLLLIVYQIADEDPKPQEEKNVPAIK